MKFALVFSLMAPPGDGWLGADKVKHFFTAAFVQSMGYGTLRAAGAGYDLALAGASGATAAASIAKEVHDRRTKGEFSGRDLVWDAAGAGAATLLIQHGDR